MAPYRSLFLALTTTLFGALPLASAYIVTTEKWEPRVPLVPGKTLFYNVIVEAKDTIVLVDITMANLLTNETTVIFGDSDLRKKDDRNAGFTVPDLLPGKQYTVRVLETSTQKFLADSPPFELFEVAGSGSVTSLGPTTLRPLPSSTIGNPQSTTNAGQSSPSPSGTSSIGTSSSPTVSNTGIPVGADAPAAETKSKSSAGAIAGGVVGGLLVLALVVAFILWRRRRTARPAQEHSATEKAESDLALPGPNTVQPYTLPPSSTRALGSMSSFTGTDGRSTMFPPAFSGAGPLPSKLAHGFTGTSGSASSVQAGWSSRSGDALRSPGGSSDGAAPEATRVAELRLERERINRELAELEQRSGGSGSAAGSSSYGGSSYKPPSSVVTGGTSHEVLAGQLAVLQGQIRQLEARQEHRESDLPPMYDGPPGVGAPATGRAPPPSQNPVDFKR